MPATQLKKRKTLQHLPKGSFVGAVATPTRRHTVKRGGRIQRKPIEPGQLPTWSDLSDAKGLNKVDLKEKAASAERGGYKTVKFVLAMMALVLTGTLYVGHVYATQDVLEQVRELRSENTVLNLEYNRLRAAFDDKTGPGKVLNKARRLGLTEDFAYAPTIWID